MRLYPRQLNSLQELKQERAALKKMLRDESASDVFNFSKKNARDEKSGDLLDSVLSLLGSKSFLDALFLLAPTILRFIPSKAKKNLLGFLAGDVLGGYLKWKLFRFALSSFKEFLPRKKKQKKND